MQHQGRQITPVVFTFDVDADEVWLAEKPAASRHPVMTSQGTYEVRVGLPAVLSLLARHQVTATFFIPGRAATTHPSTIESVLEAGHEVAHHGYTHRTPAELSYDEEVEEIQRGLDALMTFGVRPTGYRAPSWDVSPQTLNIVAEHGLRYSSNLMDDIRPYAHHNGLVELPVHWTLDDAAHFWFAADTWTKKISTNDEVEQIMNAELAGTEELGGSVIYTFHPQIIGRPGRLTLLDRLLHHATHSQTIHIMTAAELAAHEEWTQQ